MKLYERDYCLSPNETEIAEYNIVLEKEKEGLPIGRRNMYREYPEAVRHYNSLFPNNHIDLLDWKNSGKMEAFTDTFDALIHNPETKEREVLNYINHTPAHYLIMALLSYKDFGHHEAYLFPEFSIGNGTYYADYLIVGKNSGGYEFVFFELEAPNGRTTIKSGHDGQAIRSGLNQISDWKYKINSEYDSIANEFKKAGKKDTSFPSEFLKLDQTRIHYMVISGLRKDYNEVTYYERRSKAKEQGIAMYHYDNLLDLARNLQEKNTF